MFFYTLLRVIYVIDDPSSPKMLISRQKETLRDSVDCLIVPRGF